MGMNRRGVLALAAAGAAALFPGGAAAAAGAAEENADSEWPELAHFLYGRGFWYADPLREVRGLTTEQLLWVPDPQSLCMLWQVGHVAHRERTHIGRFLQGLEGEIIPPQYEVFGTDWHSAGQVMDSIESVEAAFDWVRDVRRESHAFVDSLREEDFHRVPPTTESELSIAHWLFITTAHTALHVGKIQLLRSLVEGTKDRPC